MRAPERLLVDDGQGTVEWVGLISLVVALVAGLGAAGARVPGTALADSVVHKIECALGEDSACGTGAAETALVRAYGRALAAEIRAHTPEVDYEAGMTARGLPELPRSCVR